MTTMEGNIHSLESFGTVDGPGLRYVVFTQGCPMRCKYCHNPDTWSTSSGQKISADEILKEYKKNHSFYKNGGITVTGGEPLLQLDFLIELFEKAKKSNIHTCIDTSGITYREDEPSYLEKLDRLMKVTDLVMLDIKHIDPVKHLELTAQPNAPVLAFANYLERQGIPLWIRHVVVPGITDQEDALYQLGYFIGGLSNLKALDVLPYHTLGKMKYQQLGIPYPLEGIPDMDKEKIPAIKKIILNGIRDKRAERNQKK